MTDLPTAAAIEAAELVGFDAGERGLPASANPWPTPATPQDRVLSWRWRNAWAGAGGSECY